jgi:hypothetical protein
MTTPATIAVQAFLAVAFVMTVSYVAGRLHQWSRRAVDRHEAFQEGYDRASQALFHLATRSSPVPESRPARPNDGSRAPSGAISGPISGPARSRKRIDAIPHSANW